jgi:hypothetical protein
MIIKIIALMTLCTEVFLYLLMGLFYMLHDRFWKAWLYKAGNICAVLIGVIGGVMMIATIVGCIIYLSANK